jgi:hypothetical protein
VFVPGLRDDAFVIRGGLFARAEDLLIAVADSYDDGDGAVASVHVGWPYSGESFEDAVERIAQQGDIPNGQIRLSTVGRLRAAGFGIELDTSGDQPDCHHNVVFTAPPDIGQSRLFVDCFDDPIPNPAKK